MPPSCRLVIRMNSENELAASSCPKHEVKELVKKLTEHLTISDFKLLSTRTVRKDEHRDEEEEERKEMKKKERKMREEVKKVQVGIEDDDVDLFKLPPPRSDCPVCYTTLPTLEFQQYQCEYMNIALMLSFYHQYISVYTYLISSK